MWPFNRKKWESLGTAITCEELTKILKAQGPSYYSLKDRTYRVLPKNEIQNLLDACRWDEPPYKINVYDCDDKAIKCMSDIRTYWAKVSKGYDALCFGYIEADLKDGTCHAYNWVLCTEGLLFFEPQTNKFITYNIAILREIWL